MPMFSVPRIPSRKPHDISHHVSWGSSGRWRFSKKIFFFWFLTTWTILRSTGQLSLWNIPQLRFVWFFFMVRLGWWFWGEDHRGQVLFSLYHIKVHTNNITSLLTLITWLKRVRQVSAPYSCSLCWPLFFILGCQAFWNAQWLHLCTTAPFLWRQLVSLTNHKSPIVI